MSRESSAAQSASIRQRLLNLAKQRNEDFNLVLTRYGLERFLHRLSLSPHRETLVLKGAMLFQLWSPVVHRATRDMDFLVLGPDNQVAIRAMIRDICTITAEDGIEFDLSKLSVVETREGDHYGGLRARFNATLGTARIPVQLDFGFGDAVTPSPIETKYPTLLAMKHPTVVAYPRATVVAEKLEAIVDLGIDNSRLKDFFDLWFIFTTFSDDQRDLAAAVKETFQRRRQELPVEVPTGLTDAFAMNSNNIKQWTAFSRRTVSGVPSLIEVVHLLRERALKIFAAVTSEQT